MHLMPFRKARPVRQEPPQEEGGVASAPGAHFWMVKRCTWWQCTRSPDALVRRL